MINHDLENVVCNLCGCERSEELFIKNGYTIRRCAKCDLVYVSPRIAARRLASEIYDSEYFNAARGYGIEDHLGEKARAEALKAADVRLDIINSYLKSGRLLDIGCAGGWFMLAASKRGWLAEGYEISDFAAEHARNKLGFKVTTGEFSSSSNDIEGQYDLVTMFDVIEHMPDPSAGLERAARALKKNGYLYAVTPNFAGLPSRILGEHWGLFQPEHHLYYFTPQTLSAMLKRAGFEPVAWNYPLLGVADIVFSAGTLGKAGISVSNEMKLKARSRFSAIRSIVRRAIGAFDTSIAAPLFAKGGGGVNIEVIAQKINRTSG